MRVYRLYLWAGGLCSAPGPPALRDAQAPRLHSPGHPGSLRLHRHPLHAHSSPCSVLGARWKRDRHTLSLQHIGEKWRIQRDSGSSRGFFREGGGGARKLKPGRNTIQQEWHCITTDNAGDRGTDPGPT